MILPRAASAHDPTWEFYISYFRKKKLVTGEESKMSELILRRKENGFWVYRRPTHEEERDYTDGDAW
jgi:hypothetical protein